MWALQRFGIRLVDSVMARAALARDETGSAPEWVLDVEAVTEAQVRSRSAAQTVADPQRSWCLIIWHGHCVAQRAFVPAAICCARM